MGPGMYHLDCGGFHPQAVEQRALGPGWARQHELERLAALPYLLNKELWEERHSMVSYTDRISGILSMVFDAKSELVEFN